TSAVRRATEPSTTSGAGTCGAKGRRWISPSATAPCRPGTCASERGSRRIPWPARVTGSRRGSGAVGTARVRSSRPPAVLSAAPRSVMAPAVLLDRHLVVAQQVVGGVLPGEPLRLGAGGLPDPPAQLRVA